MASPDLKTIVLFGIAALLVVCVVHQYDPTLFGLLGRRRYDGFTDPPVDTTGTGSTSGGMGGTTGGVTGGNLPQQSL